MLHVLLQLISEQSKLAELIDSLLQQLLWHVLRQCCHALVGAFLLLQQCIDNTFRLASTHLSEAIRAQHGRTLLCICVLLRHDFHGLGSSSAKRGHCEGVTLIRHLI